MSVFEASYKQKQMELIAHFQGCLTPEAKYQKIIELGRALPQFPEKHKIEENVVKGCQSIVYLYAEMQGEKIFFKVSSEALISAGLGALLLFVYSGESPETVLKCPPTFIEDLALHTSLTPGRSNGLSSMYLYMQKAALKFLLHKK